MRRFLIAFILAFSSICAAQLATMETLPTVVQTAQGTNTTTAIFQSNVTSGNVIVVFQQDASLASPGSDPTFTDTRSTSYTKRATGQNGTGCSSGGIRIYTGTLGSSGANTVTSGSAATSQYILAFEVSNVTETVDAVSTVNRWASSTGPSTNAITTSFSRDFIAFANADCQTGNQAQFPNPPMEYSAGSQASNNFAGGWYVAGASGSETGAFTENGTATSGSNIGIALKSTANLAVATNNIADAVSGVQYYFNLAATGGSGAYTWSITSGTLPPGLSLSGNTISGIPTASAVSCCTFQVADGAAHTASKALTITVGTSANTISLVQQHWGSGVSLNIGNVTVGNLIVCTTYLSGTGAFGVKATDTAGTLFVPLVGSLAEFNSLLGAISAVNRVFWGFAASSQVGDAVSFTVANQMTGCMEYSNVQKIYDPFVQTSLASSGGSSPVTSSNVTIPGSDMIFCSFMPVTPTTTIGAGTGYTLLTGGSGASVILNAEYQLAMAAGSQNCSFTQSGNTNGHSLLTLYGFRPTVSGTAPIASSGFPVVY